jgi:hypothetical protein
MPRPEYPGARYRVMSRQDRPEDLFVDRADRERFLRLLEARLRKDRLGGQNKIVSETSCRRLCNPV